MKFGVILPNYGEPASRLATVDTALAAENLGFDSAWVTDHMALPESDGPTYTPIFEALTTTAFLAASTRRIRLGISALVLPQRNPYEVAKQLATIDVLSGGRVMLAVGIGWSKGEFENLGYTFTNRGKRADEAIMVLRTLWRGGRVISLPGPALPLRQSPIQPAPLCNPAGRCCGRLETRPRRSAARPCSPMAGIRSTCPPRRSIRCCAWCARCWPTARLASPRA